jgi:hypothetical protein
MTAEEAHDSWQEPDRDISWSLIPRSHCPARGGPSTASCTLHLMGREAEARQAAGWLAFRFRGVSPAGWR